MRIIRRTFSNLSQSTLQIGRVGENLVTTLEVDVSRELADFKNPSFELVLKVPAAVDPYPVLVDVEDGKLTYSFSGGDLSESGTGSLELLVYGKYEELLKSTTANTVIQPSIIPSTYPGPLQKVIDDFKEDIGKITEKSAIEVVDDLPKNPPENKVVYLNGEGLYIYYENSWIPLTKDEVTALETTEDGVLMLSDKAAGNFTVTNATTGQHRGVQGEYNLHVELDGKVYLRRWVNNAWNLLYSIQLPSDTMATLAKFSEADGVPMFDGKPIAAGDAPDDVVPLELREYASLLIRENLDAVPIYVTDGNGFVIGLYADPENPDTGDMISLTDAQDTKTGLPVRILRVRRNGEYAALYSHDNHYGGLLFEGGVWYRDNTPVSAPSLSGFTPTAFCVCDDWYTDLSDLPPKAVSALRSLSQCVNADAASMGTIHVPDDTIQRFAGTLEPDRHYTQQTGLDMTLTLPPMPWKDTETVTQLDLVCTRNITLTLPREKLLDGGTLPDTTAGSHTLVFTYIPTADKWSVGCVNRVQPQYWDDIPDSVIPLEDCTWAQIKSIAEHGYVNRLGQWCIRRNNEEEVWFEIGDEKTVALSTGETWTMQILDFLHDNLSDGSGLAPLTFGMKNLSIGKYNMDTTATPTGGWNICYFRVRTVQMLLELLPEDLQNVLSVVTKICSARISGSPVYVDTQDKLFLLSGKEYGETNMPDEGSKYAIFNVQSLNKVESYWTRTQWTSSYYYKWHMIGNNGATGASQTDDANVAKKVCLAFCV